MKNKMKGLNKLFFLLLIMFLVSCGKRDKNDRGVEYMADLDMYYSHAVKEYSPSNLLEDNTSAFVPVKGTVPRNFYKYPYPNTEDGYNLAGKNLKNPIPLTPEILVQGKNYFENYCAVCHGSKGDGQGVLVKNGKFSGVPSYSSGNSSGGGLMSEIPPGRIFHVITYGRNLMGPHHYQLSPNERWAVVHYVNTLQKKN